MWVRESNIKKLKIRHSGDRQVARQCEPSCMTLIQWLQKLFSLKANRRPAQLIRMTKEFLWQRFQKLTLQEAIPQQKLRNRLSPLEVHLNSQITYVPNSKSTYQKTLSWCNWPSSAMKFTRKTSLKCDRTQCLIAAKSWGPERSKQPGLLKSLLLWLCPTVHLLHRPPVRIGTRLWSWTRILSWTRLSRRRLIGRQPAGNCFCKTPTCATLKATRLDMLTSLLCFPNQPRISTSQTYWTAPTTTEEQASANSKPASATTNGPSKAMRTSPSSLKSSSRITD